MARWENLCWQGLSSFCIIRKNPQSCWEKQPLGKPMAYLGKTYFLEVGHSLVSLEKPTILLGKKIL